MPGAAIILEGSLFCKAENGIERTFQQGDAFPTSFRTNPHTCKNTGSTTTKALVFYAGEQESASSYTDYNPHDNLCIKVKLQQTYNAEKAFHQFH